MRLSGQLRFPGPCGVKRPGTANGILATGTVCRQGRPGSVTRRALSSSEEDSTAAPNNDPSTNTEESKETLAPVVQDPELDTVPAAPDPKPTAATSSGVESDWLRPLPGDWGGVIDSQGIKEPDSSALLFHLICIAGLSIGVHHIFKLVAARQSEKNLERLPAEALVATVAREPGHAGPMIRSSLATSTPEAAAEDEPVNQHQPLVGLEDATIPTSDSGKGDDEAAARDTRNERSAVSAFTEGNAYLGQGSGANPVATVDVAADIEGVQSLKVTGEVTEQLPLHDTKEDETTLNSGLNVMDSSTIPTAGEGAVLKSFGIGAQLPTVSVGERIAAAAEGELRQEPGEAARFPDSSRRTSKCVGGPASSAAPSRDSILQLVPAGALTRGTLADGAKSTSMVQRSLSQGLPTPLPESPTGSRDAVSAVDVVAPAPINTASAEQAGPGRPDTTTRSAGVQDLSASGPLAGVGGRGGYSATNSGRSAVSVEPLAPPRVSLASVRPEPLSRAPDSSSLAHLPSDGSLSSLRERAQLALRAAASASEASQRAAAYAAAASSAASRAAEAAERAASAATVAQAGLETAAESAIVAAEVRVAQAEEAAKEAEGRAASAAAHATAYQDMSQLQADIAEKAANMHKPPTPGPLSQLHQLWRSASSAFTHGHTYSQQDLLAGDDQVAEAPSEDRADRSGGRTSQGGSGAGSAGGMHTTSSAAEAIGTRVKGFFTWLGHGDGTR